MTRKNLYLFINISTNIFIFSNFQSGAFAQQSSIFQQSYRVSKDYSNLVPPSKYVDSFLGQDKKGPYTLTWKNFNFGPGNPVWVSVDNQVLPTSSYDLDISRGEIIFNSLIKRTQVIKITYGYYADIATKNNNPNMIAPLTFRIATLGVNTLNVTTFNNNAAQDPNFVLGFYSKSNGISSNIYFAPGKTNSLDQSSMKLSYVNGNSKNGLNLDLSRNGKNFSNIYGKSFGVNDALQNINISGNLSNQKSSLSFNRKDTTNLQNNQNFVNQNAAFIMGGTRNQPLLSFSLLDQENLDSKGIYNSSNIQNGIISHKFGALDLAYNTNNSSNIVGKTNSVTSQDSIGFSLNSASNLKVPFLSFNRTNDTLDTANISSRSMSDRTQFASPIAGGNISFNSISKNLSTSNTKSQIDQRSVDLGFKGNGKNFSGLSFARSEDIKNDSNSVNVIGNKGNFGLNVGKTVFNVNFNKINNITNGINKVDQDQENILFSLPANKSMTVAKFIRNDNVKRDTKGILVGSENDTIDFNLNFNSTNLNFKSFKIGNYTADGKYTLVESGTSNVALKTAIGLINTEFTNSSSFINNSTTYSDQTKISYTLPGNTRGFSGFKFQRTNLLQDTSNLKTDTYTNELIYGTKVGPFTVSTNLLQSDLNYSNEKNGFVNKENTGINYDGLKNVKFSYTRGGNVGMDLSGIRLGQVNDLFSVSSVMSKFQWTIKNSTTDVATIDKKRIITNTDSYLFKLPSTKKNPGVELERADSNSEDSNIITNVISDKLKLNSKIGSTDLVASTGQSFTDKNNNTSAIAKDNAISISTPVWGRGTSLGLTINNSISDNGNLSEEKNGFGVNLSPVKGLTVTTEQHENLSFNSNIQTKFISGQKHSLNYSPASNTLIQGSITEFVDGTKKNEVYDYRTVVGSDKTLFKIDGLLKIRNNSEPMQILNTDSANATLNIKPAKNLTLSGNYLLNPDDPAKANTFIPIEKRQYALTHKAGSFEVTGSYSDTEHLKGTSADIIAKANGFYFYGETGLKIGWKSNSSTIFTSEYREQFFRGSTIKGSEIFSLSLNHTRASTTFSLSSSYTAAPNLAPNYRAEAKLGYKF